MKNTTRKHLTKDGYDAIKLLQTAALSIPLVTQITGRSYSTVKKVYQSDSYKQYKETPRKPAAELPKPAKETRPQEDTELILTKLDQISTCLNTLLEILQDKESKANASFWRR